MAMAALMALPLAGCGAPSVTSHHVDGLTYFTYRPTGSSTAVEYSATGVFTVEAGCIVVRLDSGTGQALTPIFVNEATLQGDKEAMNVNGTTIPLHGQPVRFVNNPLGAPPGSADLGKCPAQFVYVWNLANDRTG
jgi:hypothetical protein